MTKKKIYITALLVIILILGVLGFRYGAGVGEGEKFETFAFRAAAASLRCKPGLVAVSDSFPSRFGCMSPMCSCYVCTKCGDGICGKGENECNCKEDCKPGEGEKESQDVMSPELHQSNGFNGAIHY